MPYQTNAPHDCAIPNHRHAKHQITPPYLCKTGLCSTKPRHDKSALHHRHTTLYCTQPLLYRNYDIKYINPINDFALHSKPVYYYAKAALRLDSQHRGPAALHNAIPLQSETTQDRAIPAHHIALLCHTAASHSLAKRHLAIASRTRAKRNLAIPMHCIT